MKWLYILFFAVAIGALVSGGYLIFIQKKSPSSLSLAEKKYEAVLEKVASDSALNKFFDLRQNNEGFVLSSEGQVYFSGNLESVDNSSVVLAKDDKKLSLKNEDLSFKTGYFEQIPPSGQTVKTISPVGFKKGDYVSVVVSVNMETRKTRIVSVTKVVFNNTKEK